MASKTITIELANDGAITVTPSSQRANPNDQIRWTSKSVDFGVSFARSPFNKVDFKGKKDEPTSYESVRTDTEPGVYHYAVGVATATGVLLLAGCPEVKVEK